MNPDIDHIRRLVSDRLTTEDNGEVGLDLSNLGLVALPPEFGTLPELEPVTFLNLSGNRLRTLPETLPRMARLRGSGWTATAPAGSRRRSGGWPGWSS
ncbi:hypothetical protein ACFQ9X_06075 [Catenulispora yoronensis]